MPALENVPRVRAPSAQAFATRFLDRQRPAVLTGLFSGQPIDELRSERQARAALAAMPLALLREYAGYWMGPMIARASPPAPQRSRPTTLGTYLDHVARRPRTRLLATECETPPQLRALFRVPPLCLATPGADEMLTMTFVANRGNCAHLHFDGDHRQVLLHQVFGRKRIILVPPDQAKKVLPFKNTSLYFLENLPDEEKAAFARFTRGYDFVLNPGETAYIPALYWHFMEYLDTGMSFNLRFGRNRYSQFLGEHIHREFHVQAVGARFTVEKRVDAELKAAFRRIVRTYRRRHCSVAAKHRSMQALFERLYDELCPAALPGRVAYTDTTESEIVMGQAFYAQEVRR